MHGRALEPEQISHALAVEFPDDPGRQLVPESLYQAHYAPQPLPGRTFRTRRWRRRRRPRRAPDARSSYRLATPMVMIDQRPSAADDRVEAGHWERQPDHGLGEHLGDRDAGRAIHPGADPGPPATRADRPGCPGRPDSRFTDLLAGLRRSLTWDQGKELSAHADLTRTLAMPVYFCQPHSPWQRGSNENMNGSIRDYFPKGTDLALHTADRLAEVAAELNNRPRTTLRWTSPATLIAPHLRPQRAEVPSRLKTVVLQW